MFSKPERGQRGPHILLIPVSEDPIRLNQARLVAWALALGQEPSSEYRPSRRPHRGMLPDVDFSRAEPAPGRPGLIARLFRLFAGRPRTETAPTEGGAESGADDGALGEAERKPYLKLAAGDSDATKRDTAIRANRSRAA